jgi:tRNA(Ile)-lysidine synthase
LETPSELNLPPHANGAWVDSDKLEFPLVFRPWKTGDYFYPLGMTKPHSDKIGKKKLSDLFTDLKLSNLEKQKCRVLKSGDKIVWVAGLRLDDRFKISPHTRHIAIFTWMDQ